MLACPLSTVIKCLLKGEGRGCSRMTGLSSTARHHRRHRQPPAHVRVLCHGLPVRGVLPDGLHVPVSVSPRVTHAHLAKLTCGTVAAAAAADVAAAAGTAAAAAAAAVEKHPAAHKATATAASAAADMCRQLQQPQQTSVVAAQVSVPTGAGGACAGVRADQAARQGEVCHCISLRSCCHSTKG